MGKIHGANDWMLEKATANRSKRIRALTPLVCLFFLASGFSALIYQVAWVRILSVSFGITIYAISTVLPIFMAGLALRSYLLGRWIDRWPRPLLVYGFLELALAIYVASLVVGMPWIQEITVSLLRGRDRSHTPTSPIKFATSGPASRLMNCRPTGWVGCPVIAAVC